MQAYNRPNKYYFYNMRKNYVRGHMPFMKNESNSNSDLAPAPIALPYQKKKKKKITHKLKMGNSFFPKYIKDSYNDNDEKIDFNLNLNAKSYIPQNLILRKKEEQIHKKHLYLKFGLYFPQNESINDNDNEKK